MRSAVAVALVPLVVASAAAGCRTETSWAPRSSPVHVSEETGRRLCGPEPADHEALIQTWLDAALHDTRPAEDVEIGAPAPTSYEEPQAGWGTGPPRRWWGWKCAVRLPPAMADPRGPGGAPTTLWFFLKDRRVAFVVDPDDGTAYATDGTRVTPGDPMPGVAWE